MRNWFGVLLLGELASGVAGGVSMWARKWLGLCMGLGLGLGVAWTGDVMAQQGQDEEDARAAQQRQEQREAQQAAALAAAEAIELADVLPEYLRGMQEPLIDEGLPLADFEMELSTDSELVERHVAAGMMYVHLFWDGRARQHFAYALQQDEDCAMAWWGLALTILPQNNEFFRQRNLILQKLPTMFDGVQRWERLVMESLLLFQQQGGGRALEVLTEAMEHGGDSLSTRLLYVNYLRGTYFADGRPYPDLERAQQLANRLANEYPRNGVVAFVRLRCFSPAPYPVVEFLPQLLEPWQQGRVEFLSPYVCLMAAQVSYLQGEFERAMEALDAGLDLVQGWRDSPRASLSDCPTWVDLVELRCFVQLELGRVLEARRAALGFGQMDMALLRQDSQGMRRYLQVAPLLLSRCAQRLMRWQMALESLPAKRMQVNDEGEEVAAPLRPQVLSDWSIRATRLYLSGRVAAEHGDLAALRQTHGELLEMVAVYLELSPEAIMAGQLDFWQRQILEFDQFSLRLQMQIAVLDDSLERAVEFAKVGIDRLEQMPFVVPHRVVPTVREELGWLALEQGDVALARTAFVQGLRQGNVGQALSWLGLAHCYYALNEPRLARAALDRVARVWPLFLQQSEPVNAALRGWREEALELVFLLGWEQREADLLQGGEEATDALPAGVGKDDPNGGDAKGGVSAGAGSGQLGPAGEG